MCKLNRVTYVIALPCVDEMDRACVDRIYEGSLTLCIHLGHANGGRIAATGIMIEPAASRPGTASSAGEAPTGSGVPGRRRDVLAVLRDSVVPLSIVQIAERLHVHPNTVRFHLDTLTEAGQVERAEVAPAGPGRPALLFRARRRMDPGGPRNYRLLADILTSSLAADPDPAARATEAGRAWGRHLVDPPASSPGFTDDEAIGGLITILEGLGFAPEQRFTDGRRQIGLRHCPFLELVDTRASVVCPVHLGLMQGAMTALHAPITVQRLEPFAEPDLCLAHLGTADRTHPPSTHSPTHRKAG